MWLKSDFSLKRMSSWSDKSRRFKGARLGPSRVVESWEELEDLALPSITRHYPLGLRSSHWFALQERGIRPTEVATPPTVGQTNPRELPSIKTEELFNPETLIWEIFFFFCFSSFTLFFKLSLIGAESRVYCRAIVILTQFWERMSQHSTLSTVTFWSWRWQEVNCDFN